MTVLPAYWILRTGSKDWVKLAQKVLAPIEELGVATLAVKEFPELRSAMLTLVFQDAEYRLGVTDGQGRGVVCEDAHADVVILALLALRAQCGGLVIVGEDQRDLPRRLRNYMAILGPKWGLNAKIAESLKLYPASLVGHDVMANCRFLF